MASIFNSIARKFLGSCFLITAILPFSVAAPTKEGWSQTADKESSQLERGKALVRELGCAVCHEIKGHDTTVREEAPNLTFEGEIVQPAWLFSFLKKPHAIRPAIKARMPDFRLTDREAFAITEYLGTLLDHEPPVAQEYRYPRKTLSGETEAAKKLMSKDYFNCFNCHILGEVKPMGSPSEWAPDLSRVKVRIRPDFLFKWLQNPPKYRPGTKMPAIFPDKDSGPDDLLGGNVMRQMAAIRDYVVSIGKGESPPVNALIRTKGDAAKIPPDRYAAAKEEFKDVTPQKGRMLVLGLNCVGCHEVAVLPEGKKIAPNLTYEGSRVQKEWLINFLRSPYTIKPEYAVLGSQARMPTFPLSEADLSAVVEYVSQVLIDKELKKVDLDRALGKTGEKLFSDKRCNNCHRIGNRPGGIGPDLTEAGKRLRPEWTTNFIQRPQHYLDTRMPNLNIFPDEAKALAAYILGPKSL